MHRLLQVQKMRGCSAGTKVAELLASTLDESAKKVCFEFVRSYEPGTLSLFNHTNAEHFFGFCLQVLSGWATTVGTLVGPMRNKCEVSLPKTHRRITSSGIEPSASFSLVVVA